MLAEHRLITAYAVSSRNWLPRDGLAALYRGSFDQGVEFEDVFFLAPLLARIGETRAARVELRRENGDLSVRDPRSEDASGSSTPPDRSLVARNRRPRTATSTGSLPAVNRALLTFDEHAPDRAGEVLRFRSPVAVLEGDIPRGERSVGRAGTAGERSRKIRRTTTFIRRFWILPRARPCT